MVFFKAISESSIEFSYQRLQKVVSRYPGDPDRLPKETLVKRAADLLEQWYSMSGNPHHFALPTPPSDHDGEAAYNNGYSATFDAYSRGQSSAMSSPRGSGYHSSGSSSSVGSSHCSTYAGSAYGTPTSANSAAAVAVFGNNVPSPGFLNGTLNKKYLLISNQ